MRLAWYESRRRGGFSLIELLLVLVILATLAALVVTKFAGRSKQAKVTAAETEVSRLETALDAFEIDVGRYPTSQEGLRALYDQPGNAESWKGPYLKRGIPMDPWRNEYIYEYPGRYNQDGFDLHSPGPDGQDGTDDDIKNWSEKDV
ncbi:MAG TPA: type II secretion system protein GspG [Planctomycetes bacterium]|nr:type II secretion system protein GspG [Planctomycetota bacterium]